MKGLFQYSLFEILQCSEYEEEITDCVIMDGTIIHDHCTLDKCTLGMNVVIAPHVTLSGLRIHK